MRQGEGGGCELLLCYKQKTPEAPDASGPERRGEGQEGHSEDTTLVLPENSTEEKLKLQIIKCANPEH